jgi:hypothetical protein
LRWTVFPLISIPDASTGAPFTGSRSRKIPGPPLPTIVFPLTPTSSVGCPRSPVRMWSPAAVARRAPDSRLRSTTSPIGPETETTSRVPPERTESRIAICSVIGAYPGRPPPTTTS